MNDRNLLGAWVRRFLLEYLVGTPPRQLSRRNGTFCARLEV